MRVPKNMTQLMGTKNGIGARRMRNAVAAMLSVAVLAALGCAATPGQQGPINPTLPVGLPPTPPPASSNNFTGTQSPGRWTLSVDDTQQNFSYQAITYPASPNVLTTGSFLPVGGFLALTNSNTAPAGYAVVVPGRAVFLQPGDDTAPPVFAVEQDSCFPINGNVRFNFVYMPNEQYSNISGDPAYGSIEAQTSADSSTWSFGGQVQYVLPYTMGAPGFGTPNQPGTAVPATETYLTNFNASCTVSNGLATIAAAPNVSSIKPVSTLPTTFTVGPTGFFFEDQSTGKQTGRTNADATSFIGVIEPGSPLITSSIVSAKYVGFLREAGYGSAVMTSKTEPIGFGQLIAGSGTSLTGGTFLNDDITQFQNSNIVINLGAQDPTHNGLYSLASVTVPDPLNVCFIDPTTQHNGAGGTPGVDQFGNETCTFNAVAVIGNPENRYAIFIASTDPVSGLPMGIYLFQQQ